MTWSCGSAAALVSLLTLACSGSSSTPAAEMQPLEPGQCRADADCSGGQSCNAAASSASSAQPVRKIVAPCLFPTCNSDDQCGVGSICTTSQYDPINAAGSCPGMATCYPACTPDSCAPGLVCGASGHCEVLPCTDAAAPMCPEGWYCDAAAATAEPTMTVIGLGTQGSSAMAQPQQVLDAGCRQLRCDEQGGPTCLEGWECDTTLAAPQSVGCNALPCQETGHCSNDDFYICEPTSTNTRYDTVDEHGCVSKNCEEGFACTQYQLCDFSRPDADVVGCSFRQCTEPDGVCPGADTICDPESQYANVYGCRQPNCTEGFTCPTPGATCDPADELSDYYGCVAPDAVAPPDTTPPDTTPPDTTPPPNGGSTSMPDDTQSTDPPTMTEPPARPSGAPLGGSCQADTGCQTGYCVTGTCRVQLGQCAAR